MNPIRRRFRHPCGVVRHGISISVAMGSPVHPVAIRERQELIMSGWHGLPHRAGARSI